MTIDIHGPGTTAPKAQGVWRNSPMCKRSVKGALRHVD
jgi:hypothetical protein